MKKLAKILVLVLAVALIAGALVVATLATEDSTEKFQVGSKKYETWSEAYSAVTDGGTIKVLGDYEFKESDFTSGLSYITAISFNDSTSATAASTHYAGTTSGILIDKNVTVQLNGKTLSSNGLYAHTDSSALVGTKGYGVLFYLADGSTNALTIKGKGTISSDIPALYIADGVVNVEGNRGDIVFDYTGTERGWHIKVGAAGLDGSSNTVNKNKPTLNITGDATFTASGAVTGVINKNVTTTATDHNLNFWAVMYVSTDCTVNVTDARVVNNVSGDAPARSFATWLPVNIWASLQANINFTNSTLEHENEAPVIAFGHNNYDNWGKRGIITLDNSKVISAAANKMNAVFKLGESTKGRRGNMEVIVRNNSYVSSMGSPLFGGYETAPSSGIYGMVYVVDSTVETLGGGAGMVVGVSAIFENSHISYKGQFTVWTVPWLAKPTQAAGESEVAYNARLVAYEQTKMQLIANQTYRSIIGAPHVDAETGTVTYGKVDGTWYNAGYDSTYGGYGVLIKEGCTLNSSYYTDYTTISSNPFKWGSFNNHVGAPGLYSGYVYGWYDFMLENGASYVKDWVYYNGTFVDNRYVVMSDANKVDLGNKVDWENSTDWLTHPTTTDQIGGRSNPRIYSAAVWSELIVGNSSAARHGKYVIGTGLYSDNHYLTHTHQVGTVSGNPYIYMQSGETTATDGSGNKYYSNNLSDYAYIAIDWDMMTPTGAMTSGYAVEPWIKFIANNGTVSSSLAIGNLYYTGGRWVYRPATSGWGASSYYMDLTPGKWSHFTLVYKINLNEQLDGSGKETGTEQSEMWLYVNGEQKINITGRNALPRNAITNLQNGTYNANQAVLSHIWFYFPNSTASSAQNESASLDNITLSRYSTTYAGGADAIAERIYNGTYNLPINENDVVASVTDDSSNVTYYTDFAKAEKALRDDYTLTLIKDYEGNFTPEFPVCVNKNGKTFNYSTSGTGYLADADGDVIHFREVTEANAAFKVGDSLYMTFAEAYAAAGAGDVITLIRDYEFEAGDFTADLTYTTLLTFPDNANSCNSDALNSNTVTKGVVNGVNIDKEITLDLGGYNLSAQGLYGNTTDEGNGYGVLFYMAPTATHTFSIVGSGKISADMPLIHIAGGTVLVNGNTGNISLEYTDNERSISVRVGETIRSGSNNYNKNNPTLTLSGDVNLNTTGATPGVGHVGWSSKSNINIYAAINVSTSSTLNIIDANVTNTASDGATARSFVSWLNVAPWDSSEAAKATINITNSVVTNELESHLLTVGDVPYGAQSSFNRRADITVDNSKLYGTSTTKEMTLINVAQSSSSFRGYANVVIRNGSYVYSPGATMFGTSYGLSQNTGFSSMFYVKDSVVELGESSSGSIIAATAAIFENTDIIWRSGTFSFFSAPWATKDQVASIVTDAASLISVNAISEMYGGYGVLVKAGCTMSANLYDYKGLISAGYAPVIGKYVHVGPNGENYGRHEFTYENGAELRQSTKTINGESRTVYEVIIPALSYENIANEGFEKYEVGTMWYDRLKADGHISFVDANLIIANYSDGKVGRPGKYVIAADITGNRYLVHQHYYNANHDTSTSYIQMPLNTTYANSTYGKYAIDQFNYYSFDWDMMAPTGTVTPIRVMPYIRDGAQGKITSNALYITTGDGSAIIRQSGSSTAGITVSTEAGKWYHYTYVLAMNTETYTSYDAYLYIDGELAVVFEDVISTAVSGYVETSGHSNVALYDLWIDFPKSTEESNANEQVAIDNLAAKRFGTVYTGGCDTVLETVGVISALTYNNEYVKPHNLLFATVNGTPYYSAEDAFAAIEEGAQVVLNVNYYGTWTPTVACTINTQGNAFTCGISDSLISSKDGNVITVREPSDEDTVTLTWYNENKEQIATEIVKYGTVIEHPDYVAQDVVNGWVKITYDGWSTSYNGEKTDVTKALGDMSFYPARLEASPYLVHAMYNLGLMGNVQIDFFIPDADSRAAVGVELIKVVRVSGNTESGALTISGSGYSAKGMIYDRYTAGWVAGTDLASSKVMRVYFTYGGNEYVQTITLSAGAYVKNILERAPSDALRPTQTLLADMAVYSHSLMLATGTEVTSQMEELVALAENYKTTTTPSFPASTTTFTELSELVHSLTFKIDAYEPAYQITFKDGVTVTNVEFVINNAWITWDEYTQDDENKELAKVVGKMSYGLDAAKTMQTVGGKEYFKIVESNAIPIYNVDQVIELVITYEDTNGAKRILSGTYDINAYYNGASLNAAQKTFIAAVRNYAASAATYRFKAASTSEIEHNTVVLGSENDYNVLVEDSAIPAGIPVKASVGNKSLKLDIYYRDFGTVGNGTTDDYDALYKAHAVANYYSSIGYEVTVYGEAGKTYYLGTENNLSRQYAKSIAKDSNGNYYTYDPARNNNVQGCSITIKTDTNWNGAKFIIDDTGITTSTWTERKTAFYTPVFEVISDYAYDDNDTQVNGVPWTAQAYQPGSTLKSNGKSVAGASGTLVGQLLVGDTTLGIAPGFESYVEVTSISHKNYVRYGANSSYMNQTESYLVHADGTIDATTPVVVPFYEISWAKFTRLDDAITVENGDFTSKTSSADTYNYCERGLKVLRSNVTIKDVEHVNDRACYEAETGCPYSFFYGIYNCYNVVLDSCTLDSKKVYHDIVENDIGATGNQTLRGTYDLGMGNAIAPQIINCDHLAMYSDGYSTQIKDNWFGDDTVEYVDADGRLDHRAVMGTNGCRNVYLENTKISAFDAHSGLHNLTVRGCEIGYINLIGGGEVLLEDSIVYPTTHQSVFILRHDYNSTFNGNVTVKNVRIELADTKWVALFETAFYNYNTGIYYTNQYNAGDTYWEQDKVKGDGDDTHYYSSYMPQNITVEGLELYSGGGIDGSTQKYQREGTSWSGSTLVTEEMVDKGFASGSSTSGAYKLGLFTASMVSTDSNKGNALMMHQYRTSGSASGTYVDITTYGTAFYAGTVTAPVKGVESVTIISGSEDYSFAEYLYGTSETGNATEYQSLAIFKETVYTHNGNTVTTGALTGTSW